MTSRLTVLTGASRGLGAALADQLLEPGATLLTISRHVDDSLAAHADRARTRLTQWTRDLVDPLPVARDLESWLAARDAASIGEVVLVNNAAVLTSVGPVDESADAEIACALRVGLEAAMLLTSAFLRATRGWPARRAGACKVLNISSGLGRRPMAGSSVYCAVKAGLDHFSRAVALDEAHRGEAARIVSLAPGVIDTGMQSQLRAADPALFPERPKFVDLRESGQLARPAEAAARVLAYLRRADFGSSVVADVRD